MWFSKKSVCFIIIATLLISFIPTVYSQVNNKEEETITIEASEDSYVQGGSSSNLNYGSNDRMKVKSTSSENRDAFIKFNISELDGFAETAYLKLYLVSLESATIPSGGYEIEVRGITDNNWLEHTITYENAPIDEGTVLEQIFVSTDDVGSYVTLNVTSFITNAGSEEISFRIRGITTSRGGDFATKEHRDQRPPLLEIKMAEQSEPETPNISSIISGDSRVDLKWESVALATSYIIKRSTSPDNSFEEIAEVTSLHYSDEQVVNNETYYYKIQAVNQYGRSSESSIAHARPSKPISMEGMVVTNENGKQIKKLSKEKFIQISGEYKNITSDELIGNVSVALINEEGDFLSLYQVRKKFEPNQTIMVEFGMPIPEIKGEVDIVTFITDSLESSILLSEYEKFLQ